MIILRPKGQFGNVLFQYAFARAISLQNNDEPIFVDTEFGGSILIEMGLVEKLEEAATSYKLIFQQSNRFDWLLSQLSKMNPCGYSRIIQQESFQIKKPWFRKKNIAVHGRFQSSDYWVEYEDVIRREILHAIQRFTTKKIEKDTNALAIHIRRGDYLNEEYVNYLGALNFDYYDKAVKAVQREQCIHAIKIYTDEPTHEDVVRLSNRYECQILSSDWISDFFGLMGCEFKIISNSTFSWWAAFLSDGLESDKVYAPSPFWHRELPSGSEEVIPSWKKLNPLWI